MFPGDKIWLAVALDATAYEKPGILIDGEKEAKALVSCLAWGCAPTAALMCGELLEKRKISRFESPLEQAVRTGSVVCVSDIKEYKGS